MDSSDGSADYSSHDSSVVSGDHTIIMAAAAAQQHYEALLRELHDGQRQLLAAHNLCQSLRKDNLALSENFEKVR